VALAALARDTWFSPAAFLLAFLLDHAPDRVAPLAPLFLAAHPRQLEAVLVAFLDKGGAPWRDSPRPFVRRGSTCAQGSKPCCQKLIAHARLQTATAVPGEVGMKQRRRRVALRSRLTRWEHPEAALRFADPKPTWVVEVQQRH
jgi:hypothetical protein